MACPDGWESATVFAGIGICDPWPGGRPDNCELRAGSSSFVGERGCVSVGDVCPSTTFAESSGPEAPSVYVDPTADGGNGSRDDPYSSLSTAIANAPDGAVISLAKGTYEPARPLELTRAVELRGACPAETVLKGKHDGPVVRVESAAVTLRNLSMQATSGAAGVITAQGQATLEGIVVEGAVGRGLAVLGGQLDGHSVVIHAVQAAAGMDAHGPRGALVVASGGHTRLERLHVLETEGTGVVATGSETTVQLQDVAVRETQQYDNAGGVGLEIAASAQLTLRRTALEHNASEGVFVHEHGELVVEDAVIRHNSESTSAPEKGGLRAVDGAAVEIRRGLFQSNVGGGLFIAASHGRLEDLVVLDSKPTSEGADGHGLRFMEDARGTLRRLAFARNHNSGMKFSTSTIDARDVVCRDTRPEANSGEGGHGVIAQLASELDLRRILVEGARTSAIRVFEQTTANIRDLTVRNTESDPELGRGGRGLNARFGADVTLTRAVVENNREVGVAISGATTNATLQDVRISRTHGRAVDGRFGSGVLINDATVDIAQSVIDRSRYVGMLMVRSSEAQLSDVVIDKTRVQECESSDSCETREEFGHNLGIYHNAILQAERFGVRDGSLCGIQLTSTKTVELEQGIVADNLIGACVQTDIQELQQLTNRVRYQENRRNLDATQLPIPEPAPPLAGRSL
jgi:hypothetical protein